MITGQLRPFVGRFHLLCTIYPVTGESQVVYGNKCSVCVCHQFHALQNEVSLMASYDENRYDATKETCDEHQFNVAHHLIIQRVHEGVSIPCIILFYTSLQTLTINL